MRVERKRQKKEEERGVFVREEIHDRGWMLNVGGSLCLDAVLPMRILTAEIKARLSNAHVLSFLLTLQTSAHISLGL